MRKKIKLWSLTVEVFIEKWMFIYIRLLWSGIIDINQNSLSLNDFIKKKKPSIYTYKYKYNFYINTVNEKKGKNNNRNINS